jgi:hypothetical protein
MRGHFVVGALGLGLLGTGLLLLALDARAGVGAPAARSREGLAPALEPTPPTLTSFDDCVEAAADWAAEYAQACRSAQDACARDMCAGAPDAACLALCESTRLRCDARAGHGLADARARCSARAQLGAAATAAFPNAFCTGHADARAGWRAEREGDGYICARAIGRPGCASAAELGSLRCACCACYEPCGMRRTAWADCAEASFGGSARGKCGGEHAGVVAGE